MRLLKQKYALDKDEIRYNGEVIAFIINDWNSIYITPNYGCDIVAKLEYYNSNDLTPKSIEECALEWLSDNGYELVDENQLDLFEG